MIIAYDCLGKGPGKPSTPLPGMKTLWVNGNLWRKDQFPLTPQSEPDPVFITNLATTLPQDGTAMMAPDVECWNPLDPENIRRDGVILDALHAGCPTGQFGMYNRPVMPYNAAQLTGQPSTSMPPSGSEYARQMLGYRQGQWNTGPEYDRVLNLNSRSVAATAGKNDFVMPWLYASFKDRDGWCNHAQAAMTAARAYRQPIIPIVCPVYVGSNATPYFNTYIELEFMQLQYSLLVALGAAGIATFLSEKFPYAPATWLPAAKAAMGF